MPLVRLLGPVDVVDDAGDVHVPRTAIQKTLLALLALDAGRVVDPDRLLDLAWDGSPPESGRRALRFHISQIRRGVPVDGLIATVPGGYRLDADTDLVAVDTTIHAATDAASAGERLALTDAAIAHWRGEVLVDAAPCVASERERERWNERFLTVTELRQRARIEYGEHTRVIADLGTVCADHPLRESLWALLIEAQYRSGNQDESLRSLRQLRANLIDELGASPGPTIVELEQRILTHAPELTTPRREPAIVRRGNLRRPVTSFIGRATELDALDELLDDGARVLALLGMGGVGKTRLVLELAERRGDRYPGGIWVVDLSLIDDPERIDAHVAAVLGLQPDTTRTDRDVIIDVLSFSPALLVLDTCEHLVGAVSRLVDELVASCDPLTIVATSRQTLASQAATSRSVESIGDDAVQLFTERAADTRGGFELTDANRGYLERICERLDGTPLAIELVAARTSTLDPATLADRLDDVMALAKDTRGGRTGRQESLAATLDWSYRLLDESEQALFDRLSVFTGGFTLDAAEAACTDDVVSTAAVVDVLEALVDHSLVVASDDPVTGRRFHLLDTTRAYGKRRLAEAQDVDLWRARPARHFSEWAKQAPRLSLSDDHAARINAQVVLELGNLREASQWACGHQDLDAAIGLTSVTGLVLLVGRYDAASWLRPIVDLPELDQHPDAQRALRSVGMLLQTLGDLDAGDDLLRRGMAIEETGWLWSGLAYSGRVRAQATAPPDPDLWASALAHARRAAEGLGPTLQDKMSLGILLWFLADERAEEEFYEHFDTVMDVFASTTGPGKVLLSNYFGALAVFDPELGRERLLEAIPRSVEFGMITYTWRLRRHLAMLDSRSGDHEQAVTTLVELIDDEIGAGAWSSAYGWMHSLVIVLADAGIVEEAVVLHHGIPPGVSITWGGDAPITVLDDARARLGDQRYDELARTGASLDRAAVLDLVHKTASLLDSP